MSIGAAGARAEAVLQRVFGDAVPADAAHALGALEQSPLKPSDPAELQAVRTLVLARAQAAMAALESSGYVPARLLDKDPAGAQPVSALSLPALSLRLQELSKPLDPVITEARAAALFELLATDESIPHDFIDEGCHFRAHVEAQKLEDAGVYSEKVFMRPVSGSDLKISSDKSPIGFTLGIFHTAPVVLVKTDEGVERRVLDPSLGDAPMPLAVWQKKMASAGGGPCETFYLPRFAFHLSDRYDPPTVWRQADVYESLEWNDTYKELWTQMKQSGFYSSLKDMLATQEEAARV